MHSGEAALLTAGVLLERFTLSALRTGILAAFPAVPLALATWVVTGDRYN